MHAQIVSASAIQPNLGAAGVVLPGDSLTVLNARQAAGCDIIAMWSTNQVAGFTQLAFPSGHDTTRGYRAGASIGINPAMLPLGQTIAVTPQELLSITIAGSNVAADVENMSMLLWYGDFPGIDARLITSSQLESRIEKYTTIETSIVSAAGPGYSGEVTITTSSDLLMANRDYAIMGISSRTACHALTVRGPDLGNVRLGCPGVLRQELTSQWFVMLSRAIGKPMIPVFSSGNKSQTLVGVATDENAGTFLTTLYLALLKK